MPQPADREMSVAKNERVRPSPVKRKATRLAAGAALSAWAFMSVAALAAPRAPAPDLNSTRMPDWKVVGSDADAFHYVDAHILFRAMVDPDHTDVLVISELIDNKADATQRDQAESSITKYAFDCSAGLGRQLERAYFTQHMGLGGAARGPRAEDRSAAEWRKLAAGSDEGVLMKFACAKVPPRR